MANAPYVTAMAIEPSLLTRLYLAARRVVGL